MKRYNKKYISHTVFSLGEIWNLLSLIRSFLEPEVLKWLESEVKGQVWYKLGIPSNFLQRNLRSEPIWSRSRSSPGGWSDMTKMKINHLLTGKILPRIIPGASGFLKWPRAEPSVILRSFGTRDNSSEISSQLNNSYFAPSPTVTFARIKMHFWFSDQGPKMPEWLIIRTFLVLSWRRPSKSEPP